MSSASRIVIMVGLLLGVGAGIAGFVVREPIERAYFLHAARALTGLESLDADRLDRDGDAYVLSNVRATLPDGSFSFVAPQARVVKEGDAGYHVSLEKPTVRFDPQKYRDADLTQVRSGLASGSGTNASIAITNGTLEIGPLTAPALLVAKNIAGTLDARPTRATFDGTLIVNDPSSPSTAIAPTAAATMLAATTLSPTTVAETTRAQALAPALNATSSTYTITGKTDDDDGTFVQTWSADALPVAAFAPLVDPAATVRPISGMIHDLAVDDGPNFHATAKLADVKVALGDHVLHGLHGKLIAVGDGVGTADVEGFLDNVTFRADGEVHDLRSHYRWLAQGTNDLQSLGKLALTIAAEPQLRGPVELEAIAPGLSLGQYHLLGDHGPLAISVLSADPTEKTLRFDTAIAGDHVISNGERTSAMGVRTGAVAGVNGDYFDIGRTYQPQGMLVSAGELIRGPTDRAVATIDRNMHATFGEFRMTGELETARGKERVTEFNDWPPGYVSVITPRYGVELKPGAATFVQLAPLGGSKYRVANVTPGDQTIPVSFGVAIGHNAKIPMPKIGETVTLKYATDPPLGAASMAIGGGPILVKDSLPYEDPHAPAPDERDYRWPVVALAQMKDARLDLIAVDGRHPERSVGMTRPEFSELLERFGATDAMALDSGGSVTLVARAPGDANVTVRNVVSDFSNERWISDALYLYSSAPQPSIVTPTIATTPLPEERPTP
jgi:hypothetical protein